MSSIGIRVTTSEIYYIIFGGDKVNPTFITKGKINEPTSYLLPQVLTYYKGHLESIFKEFNITKCGIKIAEPMSSRMGKNEGTKKRMYIEGVLMETINSNGLNLVYGPFATFAPLVGIRKIDDYMKVDEFCNIPDWNKVNKNHKEASLAGIGAL